MLGRLTLTEHEAARYLPVLQCADLIRHPAAPAMITITTGIPQLNLTVRIPRRTHLLPLLLVPLVLVILVLVILELAQHHKRWGGWRSVVIHVPASGTSVVLKVPKRAVRRTDSRTSTLRGAPIS